MFRHTATPDECALSVAARHGTPWAALWERPENAAVPARRSDPAVLHPDDVLFVPEAEPAR